MKNFTFILSLTLAFSLGLAASSLAFSSEEAGLIDRLFEQAGVNREIADDGKELDKLAGAEEPFQNLYLHTYENIKKAPHEAAIAMLAATSPYNKIQLEAIITEGKVSPILTAWEEWAINKESKSIEENEAEQLAFEQSVSSILNQMSGQVSSDVMSDLEEIYSSYSPENVSSDQFSEVYTQAEVVDAYTEILDRYDAELAAQRSIKKLNYETLSQEIFLNGDLSDSGGVDLLYDLDLMNYLLFGEFIAWPDRSVGDDVELASDSSSAVASGGGFRPADNAPIFLASESSSSVLPFNEVLLAAEEDSALDPYACFDDGSLRAALEAYDSSDLNSGLTLDEIADGVSEADGNGEFEFDENRGGTGSDSGTSTEDFEGTSEQEEALDDLGSFANQWSGSEADWSRELPCNDIFCITIDLITEGNDAEEIQVNENHVRAHTLMIGESIQDTLAKSLVPSKVSMNWFEDGTCKEAGLLVNLDFNVELQAVPIDLDPGDEVDSYAAAQVEKLQEDLAVLAQQDPSYGCESLLNLGDLVGTGRLIEDHLEQCQALQAEYEQDVRDLYASYLIQDEVQAGATVYEQVNAELYTLLLYFDAFQDALSQTYESNVWGESPGPLTDMAKNTDYCQ
jgi:hypothetical protein